MVRSGMCCSKCAITAIVFHYREALEKNGKEFIMHTYESTRHGFHNNSTPRYNEPQAKLAWERSMAFFKEQLS